MSNLKFRTGPSGPVTPSNVFYATGIIGGVETAVEGEHFVALGAPEPTPNPITRPEQKALLVPPGKYSVEVFNRFSNAGSNYTLWQLEVGAETIWSWISQAASTNVWVTIPGYFEVLVPTLLKLKYTNFADSDPASFGGSYHITRLDD